MQLLWFRTCSFRHKLYRSYQIIETFPARLCRLNAKYLLMWLALVMPRNNTKYYGLLFLFYWFPFICIFVLFFSLTFSALVLFFVTLNRFAILSSWSIKSPLKFKSVKDLVLYLYVYSTCFVLQDWTCLLTILAWNN